MENTNKEEIKVSEVDMIMDMETSDPDDFFNLCFLLSHPRCKLRAVTIYPGSLNQVGLVRETLRIANRLDVLVGSHNPSHPKSSVSGFHFSVLPNIREEKPDGLAYEVMYNTLQKFPNAVVMTGGPPFNLETLLKKHEDISISTWYAQGGFAGDSIVEKQNRLKSFDGKEVCVSANWMSVATIDYLLSSKQIKQRVAVSKNVCHGVVYNKTAHEIIEKIENKHPALNLLYQGMTKYLAKNPTGKKFHDPLAASVALNWNICEFEEVKFYHTAKNEWGCNKEKGTNTFVAVSVNQQLFFETLGGVK